MSKTILLKSDQHSITHWKCLLRFCTKFPSVVIPVHELKIDKQTCVQQYIFISIDYSCSVMCMVDIHTKNKNILLCSTVPTTETSTKVYIQNKLCQFRLPFITFIISSKFHQSKS